MSLTISELCSLDRVATKIDVSRWTHRAGDTVCISELSAAEYYDTHSEQATSGDREPLHRLAALSLCDEDGKKLVPPGNATEFQNAVESMRNIPISMLMTIVGEANRLNSVDGENVDEELEKN